MTATRLHECPECGATCAEALKANFCSRCGQRLAIGPLRLGDILSEFVGTLLSFEFPILLTARDLSAGPGRVASAWIAGRRRSYVNPIKFIAIIGVVVALAYSPLQDLKLSAREESGAVYQVGLAHHTDQYFAFFCILLLLPIALVTRAFARQVGIGRTWLDWYVLGLYCFGLATLIQFAFELLGLAFPALAWLRWLELATPVVLLAWGAAGFVDRGFRVRALLASLLALIAVLVMLAVVYEQFGMGA